MGGNGGCGEFDILEAIADNQYSDMLFTQVSFALLYLLGYMDEIFIAWKSASCL